MQSAIASIIQSTDSIGEEELIIIFIARLKLKGKYLGERYPASLSSHRWGVSQDGGGGGEKKQNNSLYGEAMPKRDTFYRLQVYERVGISLVEVYERVWHSIILVCKKAQKD